MVVRMLAPCPARSRHSANGHVSPQCKGVSVLAGDGAVILSAAPGSRSPVSPEGGHPVRHHSFGLRNGKNCRKKRRGRWKGVTGCSTGRVLGSLGMGEAGCLLHSRLAPGCVSETWSPGAQLHQIQPELGIYGQISSVFVSRPHSGLKHRSITQEKL